MQALFPILSSLIEATVFLRTNGPCVATVSIDVILDFSTLDLSFTAFWMSWTLDHKLIEYIDQDP